MIVTKCQWHIESDTDSCSDGECVGYGDSCRSRYSDSCSDGDDDSGSGSCFHSAGNRESGGDCGCHSDSNSESVNGSDSDGVNEIDSGRQKTVTMFFR